MPLWVSIITFESLNRAFEPLSQHCTSYHNACDCGGSTLTTHHFVDYVNVRLRSLYYPWLQSQLLGTLFANLGTRPETLTLSRVHWATLLSSERPIILAGGGTIISSAFAELQAVAETLLIPVATTFKGKGAFPENHALSLGPSYYRYLRFRGAEGQVCPFLCFHLYVDTACAYA